MEPPKKFDVKKAVPISAGPPSKFDMANALPIDMSDDIKNNPSGQGLYKMIKNGDTLHVPFGRVLDTGKLGWEILPDEFKRFTKDYTHQLGHRAEIDAALSPEDESTWKGKGLNIFKGTTAGLVTPFTHPLQTIHGLGENAEAVGYMPGVPYTLAGHSSFAGSSELDQANLADQKRMQEKLAPDQQQTLEHPVYGVSSIVGPAVVMHGAGMVLPKVLPLETIRELRNTAVENLRRGIRNSFQGGEQFTQDRVNDLGEWSDKRDQILLDHQNAVKQVQADNTQALNEHVAEVDRVSAERHKGEEIIAAREALERDIESAQEEYNQKLKLAEHNANANNDTLWDAWRDAVKGQTTTTTPIRDAITSASESHLMKPDDVAEFRKIMKESESESGSDVEKLKQDIMGGQFPGKKYEELTEQERGHIDNVIKSYGLDPAAANLPPDADATRIHVWKTQLEYAERNATRGAVRDAIGQVLDKVRDAESDLTKKAGPQASQILDKAREQHKKFSNAFRNPIGKRTTAARATQQHYTKEPTQAEDLAENLAKVGVHDPDLINLATRIDNARAHLDALPTETEAKAMIKPNPDPPKLKVVPKAPELPKQPTYTKPPYSRNKPDPTEVKFAEDFTPDRKALLLANLKKYGKVGQWATRMVLGAGGQYILSEMTDKPGMTPGKFGTGLFIGQGAMRLFANILSHDSVMDWMLKPSAEDLKIIDTLSPFDAARMRATMKGLIQEEAAKNPAAFRGAKIAPSIAAFLGVSSNGLPVKRKTLDELEQEADKSKTQQPTPQPTVAAPAPGPQSSVTSPITHVYDQQRGVITPV